MSGRKRRSGPKSEKDEQKSANDTPGQNPITKQAHAAEYPKSDEIGPECQSPEDFEVRADPGAGEFMMTPDSIPEPHGEEENSGQDHIYGQLFDLLDRGQNTCQRAALLQLQVALLNEIHESSSRTNSPGAIC